MHYLEYLLLITFVQTFLFFKVLLDVIAMERELRRLRFLCAYLFAMSQVQSAKTAKNGSVGDVVPLHGTRHLL